MNNQTAFITLSYLTNTLALSEYEYVNNQLNPIKPLIEINRDLITVLVMNENISSNNFYKIKHLLNTVRFIEEELVVLDFLSIFNKKLYEDAGVTIGAIANVSGGMVATDTPKIFNTDVEKYKKRFPSFEVNNNIFNSISSNSISSRKVLGGLNLESYEEKMLYNFSKNNPSKSFVLKNNNKVKFII